MNILLADDEKVITSLIERICNKNGIEVITVHNGIDAENELLNNDYDLCILDYSMPGKNGEQVLESVHSKTKTPIIMLSAFDKPEILDKVAGDIRLYIRKGDLNIESLPTFIKTISMIGKY